MSRLLFLTTLFVPAFSLADCGVARSEGAIHLLVGSKGSCFSNEGFRETFLNDVNRELAAHPAMRPAPGRAAGRNAPPVVPGEEGQAGGRYYGQR